MADNQALFIPMEGGAMISTPTEEDQAALTLQEDYLHQEEYLHQSDLLAETYGELYVLRFDGEADEETLVELDEETESSLKRMAGILEAQLADIEEEMMFQ